MVGAPRGTSRKRKQSHEHDQSVIDVDTWLQEARQANDVEDMRCFTRTILHHTTTTTHSYKKPRTLAMLHHCRTSTLNRMEDLTHRRDTGIPVCLYLCARHEALERSTVTLRQRTGRKTCLPHHLDYTHTRPSTSHVHTTCGNNMSRKQLRLIMPQSGEPTHST